MANSISSSPELRPAEAPSLPAQELFNTIHDSLLNITDFKEIVYENVPPSVGSSVAATLSKNPEMERELLRINYNSRTETMRIVVRPTQIHYAHLRWIIGEISAMLADEFLSFEELEPFETGTGRTITGFSGIYSGSSQDPDLCIKMIKDCSPTLVAGSAWSESWSHLLSEKDLWFSGTLTVRCVILFSWTKIANDQIKGFVEIYRRNELGDADLFRHEDIFPAPTGQRAIPVTIGDIFGENAFEGRDPGDSWQMSLGRLRSYARNRVAHMGLFPAV